MFRWGYLNEKKYSWPLVKCNGVKNKETFLFSQKCWSRHIFCCRKTWRHNVSVCHLAGKCNATSLACLSCVTKLLIFCAHLCITSEAGIMALTGPRENGHENERKVSLYKLYTHLWEQEGRSGESARLPPTMLGFDSAQVSCVGWVCCWF